MDEARLTKEAERSRQLEAERQRLDADEQTQAREREKQRQVTEAKLVELRSNTLAAPDNAELTLEMECQWRGSRSYR